LNTGEAIESANQASASTHATSNEEEKLNKTETINKANILAPVMNL
jgi:hypothetical protein